MRLIDDDKPRAAVEELVAAAIGFDVVQADHGVGVALEDRLALQQVALETRGGVAADDLRAQVEFLGELFLPLLAQVWGAEHGEALDLAAIDQLAHDQPGLDGLADTYVVGDQQADHWLAKGHQQRHQLVGTGFEGEIADGAERASPGAQLEQQGIA